MRSPSSILVTALVALGAASTAREAAADVPVGWREGTPLPRGAFVRHAQTEVSEICKQDTGACFAQQRLDASSLPALLAGFDVPVGDLPVAVEQALDPAVAEPSSAPKLRIRDDWGRPPSSPKAFAEHKSVRFMPEGVMGTIVLNDEVGGFGPRSLEYGLHHHDDFPAPKNDGPFWFEALGKYDAGTSGVFDRVEGTVDASLGVHVTRWLRGEAAPVAWGFFHAVRVPTDAGEKIVFMSDESVRSLSTVAGESSAMTTFVDQDQSAILIQRRIMAATRWDSHQRVLVDVTTPSGERPTVRIRILSQRTFF